MFCKTPRTIDNAINNAFADQQTFDVGSEVEYRCKDGFTMRGFARAKCLAMDISASWFGPDITCERKCLEIYSPFSSSSLSAFSQLFGVG